VQISFIASSIETELVSNPIPAKNYIPSWYKNIKSNFKKQPKFSNNGKLINTDLKMCMPFLDSLTTGYIQETWCDMYVKKETKEIIFYSSNIPKMVNFREKKSIDILENEFYPIEFTWSIEWINKTPKNYSVLICHPLNRLDLPFYTLSGIIDSDLYHHAPSGNLPFYIKKDFEGLIPKGTPMYQIIPIKRESWTHNIEKYSIKNKKKLDKQNQVFWEFYKKNFWNKKNYY
jgi:hypothetical protein